VDELAGSTPSALLFTAVRDTVIRHYQWMLRTDFLPRIVDPQIVDDVFTHGRRFFEVPGGYDDPGWYPASGDNRVEPGDRPTMPIEFSVAAYRLGHSMVRDATTGTRSSTTPGYRPRCCCCSRSPAPAGSWPRRARPIS
jgi:hypothetical protein